MCVYCILAYIYIYSVWGVGGGWGGSFAHVHVDAGESKG